MAFVKKPALLGPLLSPLRLGKLLATEFVDAADLDADKLVAANLVDAVNLASDLDVGLVHLLFLRQRHNLLHTPSDEHVEAAEAGEDQSQNGPDQDVGSTNSLWKHGSTLAPPKAGQDERVGEERGWCLHQMKAWVMAEGEEDGGAYQDGREQRVGEDAKGEGEDGGMTSQPGHRGGSTTTREAVHGVTGYLGEYREHLGSLRR